jgi:CTD kinase subunit alpha
LETGAVPQQDSPSAPLSGQSHASQIGVETDQAQQKTVEDVDNPFRPSKDLRVEDESASTELVDAEPSLGEAKATPVRPARKDPRDKGGSKISFTIKSKAVPPPKADLSQRMREAAARRETPSVPDNVKARPSTETQNEVPQQRQSQPQPQKPTQQQQQQQRPERGVVKVLKTKRTLPAEFAASESVYFRKPGNESVVGSGTYGKVFKAIHIYTKDMVALKKIRMEGERDGVSFALVANHFR